jgi:hypothetical protein
MALKYVSSFAGRCLEVCGFAPVALRHATSFGNFTTAVSLKLAVPDDWLARSSLGAGLGVNCLLVPVLEPRPGAVAEDQAQAAG